MLFQPSFPDSDPEPLSPSSHEDTTRPTWSHAILVEPSYDTTQHLQFQATDPSFSGSGTAYQAPSSSPAYSPTSNVELGYVGTLAETGQVSSGSHSLLTNSSQYGYGLHDDDEDEEDEVEDEEDTLRFAVAAREIEKLEEEYVQQQQQQQQQEPQQQQQQQEAMVIEDDEHESELNTLYPVTQPFTEAVPAGVGSDVPETTYTTRTGPFVHLEIQELRTSQSNSGHEQQHRLTGTLPRPRQFIFEPNTRLLLGRAPSSGLDPKARLKQLSEVGKDAGQARAENGYDDGLFANQVISKLHATIFERDGQLVLEDWESTHGTFVNEKSVTRKALHDLDRVRLGRPVTRRDIHYQPLEFVVRIQSREHYEHPSTRADPADLVAGIDQQMMTDILDNSADTSTPQSQKTVILLDDDDFEEEDQADLLARTQTRVESLDVQEPLERTPTDEQEAQEAQHEDDTFYGIENDYEADEDETNVDYDDGDGAFEQPEQGYEEGPQLDFEVEDAAIEQFGDDFWAGGGEPSAYDEQRKQRKEYDVDDDEEEEAFSRKAADYELDDDEDDVLLTRYEPAQSDLTEIINSATIRDAPEDDEDMPTVDETVIKETTSTSTTTTTVTIATALPTDAVVEESQGNNLKRKHSELEDEPPVSLHIAQQELQTSKSRRAALLAAALAGVVVGSVGTVLTLANI
ncbi:hypothetical protein KI688_005518 [Linnemannia hyalina]|uniref:FHA domain-containing protein n=1 Tax=Linnemannia hyalina TaxID=64524 RepID=A0A9P8BZE3_9FUNG|nr:hypothetical protein KI688_005518 [Linnemannia hyalina]